MKILPSEELLQIFVTILDETKSLAEWAEVESDDMFQTEHFCGGFDATENEFCFSNFVDGNELWFQLGLMDIQAIVNGKDIPIDARVARETSKS